MKTINAIVLLVAISFTSAAAAKDYVFAVSPHQDAISAETMIKAIINHVITRGKGGDRAIFVDGYNRQSLGTITLPEDKKYNAPKARLMKNRAAIAGIINFARAARSNTTAPNNLLVPQLIRFVGEDLFSANELDLIVVGSPMYHNPHELQFSMHDGRIPSDAFLRTSRTESPFSTVGLDETLTGLRVHFIYPSGSFNYGDAQEYLVKRFWSLHLQQQGAELTSFVSDLNVVLSKLQSANKRRAPRTFVLDTDQKLEMIQLGRTEPDHVSILERDLTTRALSKREISAGAQVELGLTWSCTTCDLDLYAVPFPGATPLYFGKTKTLQGRYWKDFKTSPETSHGQEIIQFTVPLDLNAIRFFVSFYNGHAPRGVNGEVRVSVNGKTYAKPFHVPATRGQKGKGMPQVIQAGTSQAAHILAFRPLTVIKTQTGS